MRLLKSNIDADVERKTVHRPSMWETSELTLRVKFLPSLPHTLIPSFNFPHLQLIFAFIYIVLTVSLGLLFLFSIFYL